MNPLKTDRSHLLDQAWEVLAKKEINAGDPVCLNSNDFEKWQYMGNPAEKNIFVFRHRSHPRTHQIHQSIHKMSSSSHQKRISSIFGI